MYITSKQLNIISENELASIECQNNLKLPQQYRNFLNTYGYGTYGGAICIQTSDFDLLEEYSEYDFWEYENAPITRGQTKECAVIGNSIDGDYIALHSEVNGYILLPRHSDEILLIPFGDEGFVETLDKIGYHLYEENLERYFEPFKPAENKHLFMHAKDKDLRKLAKQFQKAFSYDYLINNSNVSKVFLYRMGGYVRFNFSYGFEVAVFYCDYGEECFHEVVGFLKENGCK